MKNYLKRIGIIISIILNITFVSGYYYKTFWEKKEGSWVVRPQVKRILRQLRLSDEQKGKIRNSTDSLRKEVSKIRGQIEARRMEMIELLSSPHPDREAIELKRQAIVSLQQELQKLVLDNLLENKKVLTPEQQRKLFSYLKIGIKRSFEGGER